MKLHNPLPESLAISCTKAASILEHFIKGNNELDKKLIPTNVLKQAYGVAIMTIVKAGCLWSGRAGTGLVVSRLGDGSWSAPSAICAVGVGVGAQFGAQITDVIFILNNQKAVKAFSHGNLTLGGNISIAAGPTGRSSEGYSYSNKVGGSLLDQAPIYSYSKSKGLFVGLSLEGTVITTRKISNQKFYGRQVTAQALLSGNVEPPLAAEALYRMLNLRFAKFVETGSISTLNNNSVDSRPILSIKTANENTASNNNVQSPKTAAQTLFESHTKDSIGHPPKPSRTSKPKKCIALYDFVALRDGDLSFKQGDVIWISSQIGDWYEGSFCNLKGQFPVNYVSLQI